MRKRSLRNLHNFRNNERGIALLIALMALLLISAIGMGLIYMSNTETSINSNYRDTQLAFFAMRGGLEEMRDRMRSNSQNSSGVSTAITLPTAWPGTANSIVYITNPSGPSDTVDPKTYGNAYFDDEFCHESFVGSGVTYYASGTACPSTATPPSNATYTASTSPYTNTTASLKYKWVRITLKQNGTFPNAVVDSTQGASSQVCWDVNLNKERASTAMAGSATCSAAVTAGYNVEPVYLVTSLAITPQGTRRVGQYEAASLNITPPAGGLVLDGPTPSFNTPHSANAGINGTDGSGTPPAVSGCSPNTGAQPAIGTDNSADATSVAGQIFRPANFTGQGATPSVVNESTSLGNWSTPAELNTLVSQLANGADATYNCSINGVANAGATSACSGTYGSDASPQITYINGDVTLGGGAGVLIVTGTVTIHGNMEFDGLLLVIGQGAIVIDGGGHGEFYGEMLVAQTNSATSPFAQLGTLGIPSFTWNGGGKSDMYYNSCWADIANRLHYIVLGSREEMY